MVGTMLLDVAVYPNLICSLMHHLGSMAPAQAWKFCSVWKRYFALWGLAQGAGARSRSLERGLTGRRTRDRMPHIRP